MQDKALENFTPFETQTKIKQNFPNKSTVSLDMKENIKDEINSVIGLSND